jgi:RNA polymerase sigma-70 factor (ECF subfamily)
MAAGRGFPETRRSVWLAIRAGGRALERVLALYRDPIVAWLGRQGLSPEDAEDVTQEVLGRLVGVLERADPERGRLRALVKAVTRNTLTDHRRAARALKRGGPRTRVPLETVEPAVDAADGDFDAEWAANLVLQAIYRLLDGAPDGRRRQVEAVYRSAVKGLSVAELARELGVTPANAKVLVHRGRKLVTKEVHELITEYTSSGELDAELAYLRKLLPEDLRG